MLLAGCGAEQAAPKKSPEEVKKDYQQQAQRMQQDINRSRGK
jgi:hypothetical protein